MGQLRATGFVGADNLELIAQPRYLLMIGDIGCLGDITFTVEKYLAVVTEGARPADVIAGDGDLMVQTIIYSYRAGVRHHGTIMRWDNCHPRRGHADWHHLHRCDWRTDDDVGRVEWIGEARWPTLGDAVNAVADWYYDHRDELPRPDAYAEPLQRQPHILWNPYA